MPIPDELSQRGAFIRRHVGPSPTEQDQMLAAIGLESMAELLDRAVPASIRSERPLDLPRPVSEAQVLAELRDLADRNTVLTSYIGMGYTGTITPPVVRRNILENPAWYTAYTPYQPEISQGRLEMLLNFQTMISDLTGMPLANASLLDEATAGAEAMAMCRRLSRAKGEVFLLDAACHPQTIAVIETRAQPLGIRIATFDPAVDAVGDDVYGVLLQYPTSTGHIRDDRRLVADLRERGVMVTVAADLLALALLTPPGEWGADIVVGTTQRFGVPMGYGGPHAAYMAVLDEHKRALPGRLVGVSVDAAGRPAYRLALQTREQHIRREKATSNICTSQVLLAIIAAAYAVHHGPDGIRTIARRVHHHAAYLAEGLREGGVAILHDAFFDTVTAVVPGRADEVMATALAAGYNLRRVDADHVGVTLDETTRNSDVLAVLRAFGVEVSPETTQVRDTLPAELVRQSTYLDHTVFHAHRSEHDLLRYLRALADRDIALDRSMIPLGSCTMKLNATAEMEAITWPGFADLHPFVPVDQAAGYLSLIGDLERELAEITGYARVSLQPNAGSQGEFAGLLAIKRYLEEHDGADRVVCLIPSSAHGTNAASAVMAGMRVVVVACDDDGNVDVDDLKRKVTEHADTLAALMVTYPSTHGVFESRITEICDLVHDHGGQVYLDGANLNALVGVARPGIFGSDVSHLNLHKTFTIPHGGGGPGIGPIGVREHLAPYLPNHPVIAEAGPATGPGPIAAAPWGSAGILPIPWAYLRLMGARGLTHATEVAILNANYIAARLRDRFPILYSGENGLVAHECIIDIRPLQDRTGISNEDIAKRLIDYGFHAPTMSFPVAGTLMIEPTESEPKVEIDRFIAAMLAIADEIELVADGSWAPDDNPLVNAPHPAEDLLGAEWTHPYSREQAAYPVDTLRTRKYWVPVSRIDNAFGDRNLVCACPPMEAYED